MKLCSRPQVMTFDPALHCRLQALQSLSRNSWPANVNPAGLASNVSYQPPPSNWLDYNVCFPVTGTHIRPSPSSWKAPKDLTEPKPLDGGKSYKSPVTDPTTGLDLSKLPGVDPYISKLLLTMPVAPTPISVPYSMLENRDMREGRSIGLANQLDLMVATAL
ncbi:hypothetical protein DPMN_088747 [Dreissena polymorpha]|uniref:Uncharacterized protein n=1 Tax=Dreissena polymorpha TaxID=45954 RepID=A0A9D4KWT3_DREPO|nr:hypothetical protein DPMN_088747 [Dreissena polymorpha]